MTGTLLNATLARLDDVKNAIAHDDAFVPPITQHAISRTIRAIDELIQTNLAQSQKTVEIISKATEEGVNLTVGDYRITPHRDNGYWIASASGEGMQISKEKLAGWIEKLWREEF